MFQVGQIINDTYHIQEVAASSSGGVVYKAYHKQMQKRVAVKLLKGVTSIGAYADILKNLNNAYLPKVIDFFTENNEVYMVMEYIDGNNFEYLIGSGKTFDEKSVLKYAQQLCDAVNYLHCQKPPIIHGRITPSNIMLTDNDNICLIDYNVDTVTGQDSGNSFSEIGTDINGIGASLHYILTGRLPQNGVPDFTGAKVSGKLKAVITKAISQDAGKRYSTVYDLKNAIINAGKKSLDLVRVFAIVLVVFAIIFARGILAATQKTKPNNEMRPPEELVASIKTDDDNDDILSETDIPGTIETEAHSITMAGYTEAETTEVPETTTTEESTVTAAPEETTKESETTTTAKTTKETETTKESTAPKVTTTAETTTAKITTTAETTTSKVTTTEETTTTTKAASSEKKYGKDSEYVYAKGDLPAVKDPNRNYFIVNTGYLGSYEKVYMEVGYLSNNKIVSIGVVDSAYTGTKLIDSVGTTNFTRNVIMDLNSKWLLFDGKVVPAYDVDDRWVAVPCHINGEKDEYWMYYEISPSGAATQKVAVNANTEEQLTQPIKEVKFRNYCYTKDGKDDGWYTFTRDNWSYSSKTKVSVGNIHGEFVYRYIFTDREGNEITTDFIYINLE